jgi:hypothetical protein
MEIGLFENSDSSLNSGSTNYLMSDFFATFDRASLFWQPNLHWVSRSRQILINLHKYAGME